MNGLRVDVLCLRDCTTFVPLGYVDLFRKAGTLAQLGSPAARPLEVSLVSASRDRLVTGSGGVKIHCDASLHDSRRADLVLVPPVDPDIREHLQLNRDAVPWLRRMFVKGSDVATACTGAFLVAEANLLDGKAATTHWAHQAEFAQTYPRIRLEPQAVIVDQGRVTTAGGATAFLTLALYLVERYLGAEVARAASKMFLVDVNKSPQGAYAVFGPQKTHGDEDILRVQEIIERELAHLPALEKLARRVAMSRRNFVRRFKSATGNVPREYVQRARVEAAKRMLESTTQPISTLSSQVGYEDVVAFRKQFLKWTGLTPSEYRARYGPRSLPALVTRPASAV